MIAGNHDHPNRLEAVRPLLKYANISVGAQFMEPDEGGCLNLTLPSGETAAIALMPWFSRSKIVGVDDLMNKEQAEHQEKYKERYKRILNYMCSGFTPNTVNLVLAHLVVTGAIMGGGERTSETIEDYWVDPPDLNVQAQYVALGHIHKPQGLNLMWPAWYCGSPMQMDFGEEKDEKSVLVFDAAPGVPVRTPTAIPLKSGRRMMTVRGSLESLGNRVAEFGNAYLRVFVTEPPRAGLADDVRDLLPNAVEVKIDAPSLEPSSLMSRQGVQPRDLLSTYFENVSVRDHEPALKLFDELVEEELHAPPTP
jgi:exonuclease SbcD